MDRRVSRTDVRKATAAWVEDDRQKGRLDPRVMAYGREVYKRYREIENRKTGRSEA